MQADLLGGESEVATGTRELNGASMRSRGSVPSNKLKSAQEALRAALSHRGTDTLVRLGKKFHIMDDDGSKGLSYEEVCTSLLAAQVSCRVSVCILMLYMFGFVVPARSQVTNASK